MMIPICALFLSWLPASPVRFELVLEKTTFHAGEPIRVVLTAKNVSQSDVVLMKALWDGAPAATADAWLSQGGKRVETFGRSSMPMVQVSVGSQVDRSRFQIVKPGETVTLYTMNFEGMLDLGGAKARDKVTLANAREKRLPPGTYDCIVTYAFDPEKTTQTWKREFGQAIRFGPGAEALWKKAQTADVKLTKRVVIEAAEGS